MQVDCDTTNHALTRCALLHLHLLQAEVATEVLINAMMMASYLSALIRTYRSLARTGQPPKLKTSTAANGQTVVKVGRCLRAMLCAVLRPVMCSVGCGACRVGVCVGAAH